MIVKLKEKFMNKQFLSFGLIGGLNTIGSQLIYMICVSAKLKVGISSILGDVITMIFSYFLNMKFTYRTKCTLASFVAFPVSYIPGFIINFVMTIVFVEYFRVEELFAKAFSLPLTIPLNFVIMSLVVKLTTKGK